MIKDTYLRVVDKLNNMYFILRYYWVCSYPLREHLLEVTTLTYESSVDLLSDFCAPAY